ACTESLVVRRGVSVTRTTATRLERYVVVEWRFSSRPHDTIQQPHLLSPLVELEFFLSAFVSVARRGFKRVHKVGSAPRGIRVQGVLVFVEKVREHERQVHGNTSPPTINENVEAQIVRTFLALHYAHDKALWGSE